MIAILICFVVCWSFISSQVTSFSATDSVEEEVCNTNFFRASCEDDDEVIIIETAQYGRYQLGTCILEGFGYLGCMHDVMMETESFCSGRRSCEVRVDDTSFPRASPCHKDLKNHLWVSYRCYKVITPKNDCYPLGNQETIVDLMKLKQDSRHHDNDDNNNNNFQPLHQSRNKIYDIERQQTTTRAPNSFLLSSWITEQTGCGAADSPWIVVAGEGQRINLTLYDFSPEAMTSSISGSESFYKNMDSSDAMGSQNRGQAGITPLKPPSNRSMVDHGNKPTCRVLATIRESPHFRSNTICSNQGRVVNVATSLTNKIELRFLVGPKNSKVDESNKSEKSQMMKYQLQSHFLFQIKVIGCANPPIQKGMRINRIGDHVTIDCGSDSSDNWQMTCVEGVWSGHYRNCSHDSLTLHSKLEGIMPYATSIIIVGIIAVLMVCFILTAGIFCIKWRLRQDMSRSRFQPKPSISRDTEYGYPSASQQLDDRKFPLLPGGAQVSSYFPVMTSGTDNLNEYATMRLLQQNEQIFRSGALARAGGVQSLPVADPNSSNMMVIAENYRYPASHPISTKTGAMTSFLAASDSPQFAYRSDHIYECPDLVRQEVSRIVATSAAVSAAPAFVQTRELATPSKLDYPLARDATDNASRNFSL